MSSSDIPTQDDVDQWPHLQGVFLPRLDAEVGLLIASDVPKALDPLDIKHSQDGGPYASRTRIGWAVNGPLGRRHHSSRSSTFVAKVDHRLQQMIEDFYNRDFTDPTADSKTEMSQDERRFMQIAEQTVELRNGHYQISLPFKDRQTPVPSNKAQAWQHYYYCSSECRKFPSQFMAPW